MNDYDTVAEWYDSYVRTELDLAYFRSAARGAGAVLDLMAGTGRVSLAMAETSQGTVTCVDRSPRMLGRLRRKSRTTSHVRVVCGDVRELPLLPGYDLVTIPFNSIGEITPSFDQQRVISEVWRVLNPGGLFVCTLHNPAVRRASLDGRERLLGPFSLEDETSLEIRVTGTVDREGVIAVSHQEYRRVDRDGRVLERQEQSVEFQLISREQVEDMASATGFVLESLYGDYDGSGFEPKSSPFMIWSYRRS